MKKLKHAEEEKIANAIVFYFDWAKNNGHICAYERYFLRCGLPRVRSNSFRSLIEMRDLGRARRGTTHSGLILILT